jgi:chemotaxis protein CheX
MALVDSKMGEMFTKAKSEPLRGDVTGVIGWTGAMKGCLTISFSEGAILHIVSSLFGEPCTAINKDVQDAVGELSNMISGDARRALESQGYVFQSSLPTVVVGQGLRITHMIKRPSTVAPFTVAGEHEFCVETCFED